VDPAIITTLLTLIGGALGWLGKALMDAIRQYKTGHKEELQRRDEIIADKDVELTALKRRKANLRNEYNFLRAWILSQGLSEDQLTRMPKPPDDH
jgi:UDP-3-O-acyl-N-acetylglucosamine deacetylase